MSEVFADNFTVASDVNLDAYPATPDYAMSMGTSAQLKVIASIDKVSVQVTTANIQARIIKAGMPTGDQQISALCSYEGNWSAGQVNVRMATAGNLANFYMAKLEVGEANECRLYRCTDGEDWALLDSDNADISGSGETTITLKATGTDPVLLTATIGSATLTASDSTGSKKQSGVPGIGAWTQGSATIDDVSVDNLVSGIAIPVAMHHYMHN